MEQARDFLIQCGNPKMFDQTINSLGAAALIQNDKDSYLQKEGYYVMRVFSNAGFIQFAIKNQGYGKVIREIDTMQLPPPPNR